MVKKIAGGMLIKITPVEDYLKQYGLWVKREDLSCPHPGPPFSKTRGVYTRIKNRPEKIIGALDTYHSQAGHAVARACQILGKHCYNFYPEYKHEPGPRPSQLAAQELGATLIGLPAGRSAILYFKAKKLCESLGGYMMPNALKLEESIQETAIQVTYLPPSITDTVRRVIIPASSGTIAAGVINGFTERLGIRRILFLVHLGYSRSHSAVEKYLRTASRSMDAKIVIVDEQYKYKDKARAGDIPPFPCNPYYDLKAFRWWLANKQRYTGPSIFWNIG